MIKYLLDTCVVSDFVKGDVQTLKRIISTSPSMIAVSSITIMEIEYGLKLNPQKNQLLKPIITDFLNAASILSFNKEDAEKSAVIRSFLRNNGTPIGSYDILLAGTALNRQLILVTSNMKEFKYVEGLLLENWRN